MFKKEKLFLALTMFVSLFFLLPFSALGYQFHDDEGNKTYVFGEEYGTWTASSSLYIVVGDVIVPEGKTLTIEPGVEVKFDGYYGLDVKGTLQAVGTRENYITFTSNQENPNYWDWRGIRLYSQNNKIKYAIIEYATDGIYSEYSSRGSVALENSIFKNLYNGIREVKDSEIFYNDFLNMKRTVFGDIYGSTTISHNNISGYQTVFRGFWDRDLKIEKNNVMIGPDNTWFIRWSGNVNFANNYWGTDDENIIKSRIDTDSLNNNVTFTPFIESLITFNLIEPEDDTLISTSSTSTINFRWEPINGSGKDLNYYELYIDGTSTATTTETNYSYNISLSDGSHQWYVEAVKRDSSILQSNKLGFYINYATPYTPIATTIPEEECSQIGTTTWCYGDIEVSLSAKNSEFITYTLDGTEPTSTPTTSTSLYSTSTPISILASTSTPATLKAKSWVNTDNGLMGSQTMTQEYNFDLTPPAIPEAEPKGKGNVYENGVSVTLNATGSVEIRYTLDGSAPNKFSDKYTGLIQINRSSVLEAKAWDEHGNSSEIMEEDYFIKGAGGYYYRPHYWANLRTNLDEGAYISTNPLQMTLSANEETAVIRYTLDGSEVTGDSPEYTTTTPISISTATTTILKARAWAKDGAISEKLEKKYIVYDHGTPITNDINMNTTWDTSGSPYVVKRNTGIDINAKLTVKPGVEVILNPGSGLYDAGGYGYRTGKIEAIGTKDNPIKIIKFQGSQHYYGRENITAHNRSKIGYVNFENVNLSLNHSTLSNSTLDNSRLQVYFSRIEYNKFINLGKGCAWGGSEINLGNNTIFSNNYVELRQPSTECEYGPEGPPAMFGIWGSNVSIERNEFVKGKNSSDVTLFDTGTGYYSNYNVDINKNNFNFILPNNVLLIKNNSGMKVDMRNNYWGSSSDESYIAAHIYDSNDDASVGEVYYKPYVTSPLTFDLIYPNGQTFNGQSPIEFQWEPIVGNGENVDHYKLTISTNGTTTITTTTVNTTFTFSEVLGDGNYTWYVEAVKTDESSIKSNQEFNFTIDSAVDKVIAQPKGGIYITPQLVSLSYPQEGAIIRYTLDGREPTTTSAIYTGPILIDTPGTTTLKARAWYNGTSSQTMTEEYQIKTTPPEITTSTVVLAKEDVSYQPGTPEDALQGIIGEATTSQTETVGLYIELNKPATCKYSQTDKDFASISDHWYDTREGIFKTAHGTAKELIAPLGNLPVGNYRYFVICTDGVDDTKITITFERKENSIEQRPILSVDYIYPAKTTAEEATGEWNDGWQWIFNLTVPENETKLKMKFDDWHNRDDKYKTISVANNMRYYSPQSATSTDPDSAVVITASNQYPEIPMTLTEDTNQNKIGRQIQIIVEMKIPKETSNGVYSSTYGIRSEKPQ